MIPVRLWGISVLLSLLATPLVSFAQQNVIYPPTCSISVTPFIIASNSFATLSWKTEHADSVTITGMGIVPPKGNQMVRSSYDKYFYLYAKGKGGTCEHSASLSVRDPYASYGYITPTVQSIVYPLFGYQQPSRANYTYSQPAYYSTYQYEYDDYYDPDDYYYFEKYDTYYDDYLYDKYDIPSYGGGDYFIKPYADDYEIKTYEDPCGWGGCWE